MGFMDAPVSQKATPRGCDRSTARLAGLVKVLPVADGQDKSPRSIDHLKTVLVVDDLPGLLKTVQFVQAARVSASSRLD
jgi:hypothetical protein